MGILRYAYIIHQIIRSVFFFSSNLHFVVNGVFFLFVHVSKELSRIQYWLHDGNLLCGRRCANDGKKFRFQNVLIMSPIYHRYIIIIIIIA